MDKDPASKAKANSAPTSYRNPPAESRFRKGKSGNPTGRPKGSRSRPPPSRGEQLRSLMLEEAYRPVKVSEDGEEITMPMARAVFRSLAEAAAKGEARAQAMFLKIVSTSEGEEAAIEEALEEARKEEAGEQAENQPRVKIVTWVVDPVDGSRRLARPVVSPESTKGKHE